MAKSSYKLSRELVGHNGDVRGLAVCPDGSIVSASRDKSAILWKFQDGNYIGNTVMKGHGNFVSTVCVINPSQSYPKGLIVTGSNDSHILLYNPGEMEPIHKIKAHENTVCYLTSSNTQENTFLSSSWDISAKLWNLSNLDKPQMVYLGHSAAVWCVSQLPNGSIVTGSADKFVIIYLKDGTVLHKLDGHTDCIRDICSINENEFLTCANDAVIKHWSAVTGDCLGNFYGHSNYIYSVSAISGGRLAVSSGEDKTIRVWCNGELDQTITLPTQSVWSVKLLPNEDIVCGSSDGLVRIFSADAKRYADSETLQKFEELVAISERNSQQELGGMKMKDIPDSSALNQPGKKDGETKLIKHGETVKAYSWSQRELKWNLIGDVIGDNSGKQLYNGIEYDYVFSVDIQDGIPPLKLPYNNGQDPWQVAQKFIEDNNLSQHFLEQVANFIIKNSSSTTPVVNNSFESHDPLTGSSRYVPMETSTTPIAAPISKSSNTLDSLAFIPLLNFLRLEQANLTAIHDKLKEINAKQEIGLSKVTEEKLDSIVKLVTSQNQEAIEAGAINTLMSLLNWPDQVVFPVLDIARLAVLQKNVNGKLCTDELVNLLKPHLKKEAVASNQMLTFRLLANMFCHEIGEKVCLRYTNEILKSILDLPSLGNKNNQVAVSTYILNLVVALNKTSDSAGKTQVLRVICNLLVHFKEIEAVFRVLVGLGTLLTNSSANDRSELNKIVRQSENVLSILQTVSESSDDNVQRKLTSVSSQIISLIS